MAVLFLDYKTGENAGVLNREQQFFGAENSRAGIGKTYRVFNYTTILERRRASGMEWVIRTKGVRFVNREEVASVPPTDSGGIPFQ